MVPQAFPSILINLFLASAVLAAPSEPGLLQRHHNTVQHLEAPVPDVRRDPIPGLGTVAGAVHRDSIGVWRNVTGIFTIPVLTGRGAASAWVGIDGVTGNYSRFWVGVDFTAINNTAVAYHAWYTLFGMMIPLVDISHSLSAGDVIRLTTLVFNPRSGVAMVENLTKRKHVTQAVTATVDLLQQDAVWLVNDFSPALPWNPAGLANFTQINFRQTIASDGYYNHLYPDTAAMVNIACSTGKPHTGTYVDSESVVVSYHGC